MPYNNPALDILSFMPGGLRRYFPYGVPSHLHHNSGVAQALSSSNTTRQQASPNPNASSNPTISQIILEFGIVETDSLGKKEKKYYYFFNYRHNK